jgi:DNA-binding MarR family transcriptional regulator
LEGGFFSPGALKEMILPLAQAIGSGAYGATVLVVTTSDDGTAEFLEGLAARYGLAFFIAAPDEALGAARPVGTLTTTEAETLNLLRRRGGEVTSSEVAGLTGIQSNAAVNRLTSLAKKGYVCRVTRSGREGDAFVDLLSAADRTASTATTSALLHTSGAKVEIPEDVREGARIIANIEGSQPNEVLVRAWREFIARQKDALDRDSKEVGRMLREGDKKGLASYSNRNSREQAEKAALRLKK